MQKEAFLDLLIKRGDTNSKPSDFHVGLRTYFSEKALGNDARRLSSLCEKFPREISLSLIFDHGAKVKPLVEKIISGEGAKEKTPLGDLASLFKEGVCKATLNELPEDNLEIFLSFSQNFNKRVVNQLKLLLNLGLRSISQNAESNKLELSLDSWISGKSGSASFIERVTEQFQSRLTIGDAILKDAVIEHLGKFDDYLLNNPLWLLLKTTRKLSLQLEFEEAKNMFPGVNTLVEEVIIKEISKFFSINAEEAQMKEIWEIVSKIDLGLVVPDILYLSGNLSKPI